MLGLNAIQQWSALLEWHNLTVWMPGVLGGVGILLILQALKSMQTSSRTTRLVCNLIPLLVTTSTPLLLICVQAFSPSYEIWMHTSTPPTRHVCNLPPFTLDWHFMLSPAEKFQATFFHLGLGSIVPQWYHHFLVLPSLLLLIPLLFYALAFGGGYSLKELRAAGLVAQQDPMVCYSRLFQAL